MLRVIVTSPERLIYDGPAESVVLPGEQGTFEVLPLHRPLMSRLRRGLLEINQKMLPIRGGVARVADDRVLAVVELE
jgi:F0F1-type ATP synthase epsilon subunit